MQWARASRHPRRSLSVVVAVAPLPRQSHLAIVPLTTGRHPHIRARICPWSSSLSSHRLAPASIPPLSLLLSSHQLAPTCPSPLDDIVPPWHRPCALSRRRHTGWYAPVPPYRHRRRRRRTNWHQYPASPPRRHCCCVSSRCHCCHRCRHRHYWGCSIAIQNWYWCLSRCDDLASHNKVTNTRVTFHVQSRLPATPTDQTYDPCYIWWRPRPETCSYYLCGFVGAE